MGATASMTLNSRIRTLDSRNVVGVLPGSDAELRDEHVVYTAHWDHYGIGPEINGDTIYNGALDNATGVGGMIEVARALRAAGGAEALPAVPGRHRRGAGAPRSDYYARHPIYPLNRTIAVVNMDGLNITVARRTSPSWVWGRRISTTTPPRRPRTGARAPGRPEAENGGYFRSDHFPVREAGVPAINAAAETTTSAGRRGWATGVGRLHGSALPQAVGRNPPGLGPERLARRHADLLRDRGARRIGVGVAAVEARQRVQGAAGQDGGK